MMKRTYSILAPQLSVDPHAVLGGAVTDREVLYRLVERGHRIHMLLPEGEPFQEHPRVRVTWLPRNRWLQSSYGANVFFLREVRRTRQRGGYDVIRVHSPYSLGVGVSWLRYRRALSAPVWFSYLHCESRIDWRWLDRWLPRCADGVTVLSEDTHQDLRRRCPHLDHQLVKVTPLGVDPSVFQSVNGVNSKAESVVQPHYPIVLFVGSLIPRKGVDMLLRAWQLIVQRCPKTRLVIIGEGPLEPKITHAQSQDRRVVYVPRVSQAELAHWYSAASVFAFPSRREGYGLVVAEAMACGTPAVICQAPGVRALVDDGATGFQVPVDDTQAFAERVVWCLRHPAEAKAMGERGQTVAREQMDWSYGIDAVEVFLDELVGRFHTSSTRADHTALNATTVTQSQKRVEIESQ